MKRTTLLFLALLFLPMTALATTVIELDFDALTKASDAIVVGHVESVDAYVKKGRVYSAIEISVDETLKGQPGETVKIIQIGGKTKDLVTRAHGMPNFSVGEHALIFLEQPRRADGSAYDHWVVTGLAQGKKPLTAADDGPLTIRDAQTPVHTVRPKLTKIPTKTAVAAPVAAPSTLAQARERIARVIAQ